MRNIISLIKKRILIIMAGIVLGLCLVYIFGVIFYRSHVLPNTFISDVLERVYLESIVYFNNKYQFTLCPNLKKIIYVGKDPLPEIDKQSNGFETFSGSGERNILILCNLLNDGEEIKNNSLYKEANVVYKLNYETTGRDFYDLD